MRIIFAVLLIYFVIFIFRRREHIILWAKDMTFMGRDSGEQKPYASRTSKDKMVMLSAGLGAILGISLIAYSWHRLLEPGQLDFALLVGVALGFVILGASFVMHGIYFKRALLASFGALALLFSIIPAGIVTIILVGLFFLSRASR